MEPANCWERSSIVHSDLVIKEHSAKEGSQTGLAPLSAMTFEQAKPALKPDGLYLAVAGGLGEMIRSAWNKRIIVGAAPETAQAMGTLVAMLNAGQIVPLVDRTYSLEGTADAHRYVETRRKRGSVVITVAPSDNNLTQQSYRSQMLFLSFVLIVLL